MAILRIEINATNQALSKYADQLGYQTEVSNGVVDGLPSFIPTEVNTIKDTLRSRITLTLG